MTRVHVLADAEAVARHAADAVAWRIADARTAGHEVHIALAGGTTPRRAYELLGRIEGAWSHVHLWLVDERCVPADDPEANVRMIRETVYAHEPPTASTLHPLPTPEQPEDAAWAYGLQLHEHVPDLRLDLVLLGMGPDGHIASLFPGHPALQSAVAPCVAVRGAPKPPPERVTLTLGVLQRARHTMLLVTGAEKAAALARARARDPEVPAGRLGDGLDEICCDTESSPDEPIAGPASG